MLRTPAERVIIHRRYFAGESIKAISAATQYSRGMIRESIRQFRADIQTTGLNIDRLPRGELPRLVVSLIDRAAEANKKIEIFKTRRKTRAKNSRDRREN